MQTGTTRTQLRFFLTELGDHKAILGYPWFTAVQPNIDWKWGWINHTQLPIILRSSDAQRAMFLPQGQQHKKQECFYIRRAIIQPSKSWLQSIKDAMAKILTEYHNYAKIFSEQDLQ
jgi:hypothetical protein